MTTVRVRVPASSANLGPGFDSLALALALYNTVEVTALPGGGEPVVRVEVSGEGAEELPTDSTNAVVRAMEAVYARAGQSVPRLHVRLENAIPLQSGQQRLRLRSQVAAANALLSRRWIGTPVPSPPIWKAIRQRLRGRVRRADSVRRGAAASWRGGCRLPDLRVAVALPCACHARGRPPCPRRCRSRMPPRTSAGAARRAGAADADYALLAEVMCDRLHGPTAHIPGGKRLSLPHVGRALPPSLSSSGPALIFTPANHSAIAEAMREAFAAPESRREYGHCQSTRRELSSPLARRDQLTRGNHDP